MSDSKETTVIGYLVAVVILAAFFWFTLGDAYGRFMIGFDPGNSLMSYHLQPYTRGMTGLVCLAAPLLLGYVLRAVVGRWVDTAWELSARAGDWLLVNGKQLAVYSWRHASRLAGSLRKTVIEKLHGYRH
ncbi:MAG: hypothetical protein WBP44_06410 [Gammaproteobacteria bacterium]